MRIEDTDSKRNALKDNSSAVTAMIEAYEAVGITYDEGPHVGGKYGPYVQSQRLEIYKKYAEELIDKGHAYYCFCTKERLDTLRATQKKNNQKPMYDRHCRDLDIDEARARIKNGEPYVIRMKFPTEGETVCNDLIFKEVRVKNKDVEDQILIKQDGFPTYHLAVVVDDHLMRISIAIRGVDWLPSYPKHVKLYEYFGWEMPEFAHLPLILNPDGKKKLSKRYGANSIISKLREGYIREGIVNYAMLCGWAPEPEVAHQDEIYTMEELIKLFDIKRVNKTAARYDQKKFDYINASHIRRFNIDEFANRVIDWAENIVLKHFQIDDISGLEDWEVELQERVKEYLPKWKNDPDYFKKALSLEHERVVKLSELVDGLDFFYDEKMSWEDDDWNRKNHSFAELADALEGVLPKLEEIFSDGIFDHEEWERVVRGYADELGWKHGDLFMAIRSATTGRLQSPPLLDCFEVMGWERAKRFIEDGIFWLREK